MARTAEREAPSYVPDRVRRPELIRAPEQRRVFTEREAKRRLELKEKKRWALLAYLVFLLGALTIFCASYTTYAFSKYRGTILPGVHVDQLSLSGMTEKQARTALIAHLAAIYNVPFVLTYPNFRWNPKAREIGLAYHSEDTAKAAMSVGRRESFLEQLLDRLPIHPDHSVPLLYQIDHRRLQAYIQSKIVRALNSPAVNAALNDNPGDGRIVLSPSRPGILVDVPATLASIHRALGSLTKQQRAVAVHHITPVITDRDAARVRAKVEAFLNNPPLIKIGKRVIATTRVAYQPSIQFTDRLGPSPAIVMTVNENAVRAYVATIASQVDRPAQDAKMSFAGGTVQFVSKQRTGRTLDQIDATQKLVAAIKSLKPNRKIVFHVSITQPPIDLSNPASLGITTLLSTGTSQFPGAGTGRLNDITSIAGRLNNVLIAPDSDVSFTNLVGTDWADQVYLDGETDASGQVGPTDSGAMQQVATTFFRALFAAGLKPLERHPHPYRLPWYEPPVGLDAIVSPATGKDLRFRNTTHKYLLIGTLVEPVRQELYIYVYGPKLGWNVDVGKVGRVLRVYPHGPAIVKTDPSLAPGERVQTAWAHDGADTTVQRTITYPNGNVQVDQVTTHYQPWQAVIDVGAPEPTPKPKKQKPKQKAATPVPKPTPTPTFNH